jgi:hypothetical protein
MQAMQARLREGAGKIEFEFFGAQKGTKERFTPESIGSLERADLKALAEINELKTSVHGTVAITGMAGMGREGFEENARQDAFNEIRRAVDFAADVTNGGAIVLHTGEWQRPISEADWNRKKQSFESFPGEEKKATLLVVRDDTGRFIQGISKDQTIYEPVYWTAASKAKEFGFRKTPEGKYIDAHGNTMDPQDWVDIKGNYINPVDNEQLFQRVPVWNADKTRFETQPLRWQELEQKTKWFNQKYGTKYEPELFFAKTQIENQILQAKGHSLFYAQRYESHKKSFDIMKKAYDFYQKLEKDLGKEEALNLGRKGALPHELNAVHDLVRGFDSNKDKPPSELIAEAMREQEMSMRHIHEASASADVQSMTHQETLGKLKTIKDYGLEKSADTIARLGMYAMQKTEQHHLKNPLFIAPENWHPMQYGSHPQELREIVESSRKKMAELLETRYGKEKAKEIAEKHIAATFDIGHLNTWRKHFKPLEGESLNQTDKRFNEWMLKEAEQLAKDKIIGHIHLSDNMGFDDEHLTPGQGNVPIKAFMQKMEALGMKDFLIETGSFNPVTSAPETMSYFGSPVYSGSAHGIPRQFGGFFQQHFGYQAPPNYVVGAYSPSNEWKLWSEIPFE